MATVFSMVEQISSTSHFALHGRLWLSVSSVLFYLIKYCRSCIAATPNMYKQYILNDDSQCDNYSFSRSDTYQLLSLILLFVDFHKSFIHGPKSVTSVINIYVSSANTVTLSCRICSRLNNLCVSIILVVDNCVSIFLKILL